MAPHSSPSPSLFPENGGALFFALVLSQGWFAVSQICLESSQAGCRDLWLLSQTT